MSAESTTNPVEPRQELLEEYLRALRSRVETLQADEWIGGVLELGQRALDGGVELLELVALHHQAMVQTVLNRIAPEERGPAARAFAMFCYTCPGCYPESAALPESPNDGESLAKRALPPCSTTTRLLQKNISLVRLNEIREQEARRIARALHDEAAQLLAAAHLAAEEVARELESPYRERVFALRGFLNQAEEQIRCLSHELRPAVLDDFGLTRALELLAQGVSGRAGIPVSFRASLQSRLPPVIETTLYRVVQESLNNCVKHSQSTLIAIELEQRGRTVSCSVRDNGVGFDVSRVLGRNDTGSLGLIAIRERVDALDGVLSIQSTPGDGTAIVASIPVCD